MYKSFFYNNIRTNIAADKFNAITTSMTEIDASRSYIQNRTAT